MTDADWPLNVTLRADQQVVEDAINAFVEAKFRDGEPIPKDWFFVALGVPLLKPDMPLVEGQKLQIEFLGKFESFRAALLIEHSIALRTNYAGSYLIVPAGEQAGWARESLNNDLKSSFKKAGQRANFVRTDQLSAAEKRERDNVLAGIAATEAAVSGERQKMKRRAAVRSGNGAQ